MTPEEISEGNKLIAEFMGGVFHLSITTILDVPVKSPITGNPVGHIDKLRYHSSWDWLMRVVEKIESIGYSMTMDQHYKTHRAWFNHDESGIEFANGSRDPSRIVCVYECVVNFIQCYNRKVKEEAK